MKKKLFTIALSAIMVIAMAVPTFAATSYSSVAYPSALLNCATDSTPINGTLVSMWSNTGDLSQRWNQVYFSQSGQYWIQSAKNTGVAISYRNGSRAIMSSTSIYATASQGIKHVNEGTDSSGKARYGLVLPTYVYVLTASSNINGAAVNWAAPNGSSAQLWYKGIYG